jgi:probable rRNA maturation factor
MATPSQAKIYFFYDNVRFTLSNRGLLKKFIEGMFKKERKKLGSLNYIFCSDERLLQINRNYLKHDYYTDIISFDLSEPGSKVIEGEIYISIERVRNNAKTLGLTFTQELKRVLFHGALHLCGYKDKSPRDIKLMRLKEDKYLDAWQNASST